MQGLSKLTLLFPSVPIIQKDANGTTEHIAAIYVLAKQYEKSQQIKNNEVVK